MFNVNISLVVAESDYFEDGGRLYNTASLFYRETRHTIEKIHISQKKASPLIGKGASDRIMHQRYFTNTPVGNLGIVICSDLFGNAERKHGMNHQLLNRDLDILCVIACQNGAIEHYQKINQLIKDSRRSPYVVYSNILFADTDGRSAFFAYEDIKKRKHYFVDECMVQQDDYSTRLIEMPNYPGCLIFKCELPARAAKQGDRSIKPTLAFEVHRPFIFEGGRLIELSVQLRLMSNI